MQYADYALKLWCVIVGIHIEEDIVIPFPIRTLDIPPDMLAQLGRSS